MPRVPGGKPSPRERNRITPQRRFDFEAGEVRWFDTITGRHVPPLDVQRLGPDDVHYASRGGRGAEPARVIGAFYTEEMRALELAIMERIANQQYVVLPSAEKWT